MAGWNHENNPWSVEMFFLLVALLSFSIAATGGLIAHTPGLCLYELRATSHASHEKKSTGTSGRFLLSPTLDDSARHRPVGCAAGKQGDRNEVPAQPYTHKYCKGPDRGQRQQASIPFLVLQDSLVCLSLRHAAPRSRPPGLTATSSRRSSASGASSTRRRLLAIGRGAQIGAGPAGAGAGAGATQLPALLPRQQPQQQCVFRSSRCRSRSWWWQAKSCSPAIARSPSTPDPSTIFTSTSSSKWTAVNFWPPLWTASHPHPHKLFQGQPSIQDFVPPHSPDRPPPLGFFFSSHLVCPARKRSKKTRRHHVLHHPQGRRPLHPRAPRVHREGWRARLALPRHPPVCQPGEDHPQHDC